MDDMGLVEYAEWINATPERRRRPKGVSNLKALLERPTS